MKKLLLVIKTRLQFSNMFTCCVPEGEENAIELLSLKPVVCKHTICSGHSTDVNSFSLGRQKKKCKFSLVTHLRVLHYHHNLVRA